MKKQKFINLSSRVFVVLSSFSFLSVSLMAFSNPQSVMDLVNVKLANTDAFSSIRGVYGGVGLSIFLTLIYLLRKNVPAALMFLICIWGFYALSRIITIFAEGSLGAFGNQWLMTESVFFTIALVLFLAGPKLNIEKQQQA